MSSFFPRVTATTTSMVSKTAYEFIRTIPAFKTSTDIATSLFVFLHLPLQLFVVPAISNYIYTSRVTLINPKSGFII